MDGERLDCRADEVARCVGLADPLLQPNHVFPSRQEDINHVCKWVPNLFYTKIKKPFDINIVRANLKTFSINLITDAQTYLQMDVFLSYLTSTYELSCVGQQNCQWRTAISATEKVICNMHHVSLFHFVCLEIWIYIWSEYDMYTQPTRFNYANKIMTVHPTNQQTNRQTDIGKLHQ